VLATTDNKQEVYPVLREKRATGVCIVIVNKAKRTTAKGVLEAQKRPRANNIDTQMASQLVSQNNVSQLSSR